MRTLVMRELILLFRTHSVRFVSILYVAGLTFSFIVLQTRLAETVRQGPGAFELLSGFQWLAVMLLCPLVVSAVRPGRGSIASSGAGLFGPCAILFGRSLGQLAYFSILLLMGLPALVLLSLSGRSAGSGVLIRYFGFLACVWIVVQLSLRLFHEWGDRVATFVGCYSVVICILLLDYLQQRQLGSWQSPFLAVLLAVSVSCCLVWWPRRGLRSRG